MVTVVICISCELTKTCEAELNKKIRLVIPTLNFFVYISMLDRHFIKKEKKYLLGSFFSILVSVVIPKTEFVHVDSKNG